ncbi:hypothetical protein EXIGLDRAFT_775843 [Exidia glandulosa HHB12029]|nr:hypothetical protein EXIGLDRAFT_775843 [Exidia glandulosa HHB12029]
MACLEALSACPAKAALVRTLVIDFAHTWPCDVSDLIVESLCAVMQHLRGLQRLYVKTKYEFDPLLHTVCQHMRARTFDLRRLHIPAAWVRFEPKSSSPAITAQLQTLRILTFEGDLNMYEFGDNTRTWQTLCAASRHGCMFFVYDPSRAIVSLFTLFIPEASWPAYFDLFTRIYCQTDQRISQLEIYVHPTSDFARAVSLLPSSHLAPRIRRLAFIVRRLLPDEPHFPIVIGSEPLFRTLSSLTYLRHVHFDSADMEITMTIRDRLSLAAAVRDGGTELDRISFPDGRVKRQGASWTWQPRS